jgi:hypothetical protein
MTANLYDLGNFDIKPQWLNWKINGYVNACPIDVMKAGEKLNSFDWFTETSPVRLNPVGSFREEITNSAQQLIDQANGDKISVCISGRDSEVILHTLQSLGANFDMWYANYWVNGEDWPMMDKLNKCSQKYGCELHVVNISQSEFETAIFGFAQTVGVCEPAIAGLVHMISLIPENNLVVIGDGDIAKSNSRYNSVWNPNRLLAHGEAVKNHPNDIILPFIIDEVMMRIWIQKEGKRRAQCLFHHSRMELWAAAVSSLGFVYENDIGDISIADIYRNEFPDLIFRFKTDKFMHPTKGYYKNVQRQLLTDTYGDLYNETGVGSWYTANQLWQI